MPALGRGLDLLDRLRAAGAPMTAGELTEALELPRTTVHELLRTLVEHGCAEAVDGTPCRYRLGQRVALTLPYEPAAKQLRRLPKLGDPA